MAPHRQSGGEHAADGAVCPVPAIRAPDTAPILTRACRSECGSNGMRAELHVLCECRARDEGGHDGDGGVLSAKADALLASFLHCQLHVYARQGVHGLYLACGVEVRVDVYRRVRGGTHCALAERMVESVFIREDGFFRNAEALVAVPSVATKFAPPACRAGLWYTAWIMVKGYVAKGRPERQERGDGAHVQMCLLWCCVGMLREMCNLLWVARAGNSGALTSFVSVKQTKQGFPQCRIPSLSHGVQACSGGVMHIKHILKVGEGRIRSGRSLRGPAGVGFPRWL